MFKSLGITLCSVFLILVSTGSLSAEGTRVKFTPLELKKMNEFVSNITELGFLNFDLKSEGSDEILHLGNPNNRADLIRFGVRHNYLNHFKETISSSGSEKGSESLSIEANYVAESVKEFFDLELEHLSVPEADPTYRYDGKSYHFDGSDGEVYYHARVKTAVRRADGQLVLDGEIYDIENNGERLGDFTALLKPHTFQGEKTWAVLQLTTAFDRY